MNALPAAVYTAEQVRAMDRHAIERLGIPGYTLMTRAGEAALDLLADSWPRARRVLVLCGGGNNGGDGYVLGRLAKEAGLMVSVAAATDPSRLAGDAARAFAHFEAAGGCTTPLDDAAIERCDVIVDALLGTGLDRVVSGTCAEWITVINAAGKPVFAIDLPSGLHADTGAVMGVAVRAARTLTFVGLKSGLYLGAGPDHAGAVAFSGLGVPPSAATAEPVLRRIGAQQVMAALPARRRAAHKNDHGRVLIIGGGPAMPGAVRLAAEAALRAGAGLVEAATWPGHANAIVAGRAEIICHGIESPAELRPLAAVADVVAVGPGLGQSEWSRGMLEAVLACGKPLVVDADALNLLAKSPWRNANWVLTPHPGEAARLLGSTPAEVQAERCAAVRAVAERYGGVVVLKGAATLVQGHGSPWVCDRGNPGMATAGMGDVLTGVIAGIAAQAGDLEAAALAGVRIHAEAGDRAAEAGQRGLLASDVIEQLRACVNPA